MHMADEKTSILTDKFKIKFNANQHQDKWIEVVPKNWTGV